MTRVNEKEREDRNGRLHQKIGRCIDGGLASAIQNCGGSLKGVTTKYNEVEVLLVIKADFEGKAMVCFCGSGDWGRALLKAVHEGFEGKLRWREDRYVGPS